MLLGHKMTNLGVEHGRWGENVAAEYLRRGGFLIIDRNSRPVKKDRRLEIDLVVWDPTSDTMVFVEVKQHADMSEYYSRLRSIDKRKRRNLQYAFHEWRRVNKWDGAFRFDVIEIYGTPDGGRPVIDHIDHVRLSSKRGKFVKW